MKRNLFAILLIVLLAVCLCVSCTQEPETNGGGNKPGAKSTWKGTTTESDTDEDGTWVSTVEVTFSFYDDGTVSLTYNVTKLTLDGADMTSLLPKDERSETFTGTYKETSATAGTLVMQMKDDDGKDEAVNGTYSISGDTLTFSDGEQSVTLKKA